MEATASDATGGAEEVLYQSERTRVVRVRPADGSAPIIRKQPLGPRAADRLRDELSVLRRLEGVEGTPQLVAQAVHGTLAFVDKPSRPLLALSTPWDVKPLLDLAHGLAVLLAAIHRHGVVHRDVSPGNILVPLVDGTPAPHLPPILIDFELSTSLAGDGRTAVIENGLAGTLPYLAPEQTGRTGRPVDHRCDLYALGATLYELATGEPPFGRDGDPLRLVHDHLARMPRPPAEANPRIPAPLSDVTMRLLSKEPEQRYQSGEGLAHDLARVRDAYEHGTNTTFALGARDFPMRLAPPGGLVGRAKPLAALRGLLAEAVTGNHRVAMVTGPPGVGKTALIGQLRPAVAAAGGRFVAGKFDQYRRDLGADAMGQAFSALGSQLLAAPDEEVAVLRDHLLEVLGPNAGLAAAVLPPFAALLGVSPEADAEDRRTVGARIRQVGLGLLRTIASSAHPVVFFLDDLQWAGPSAFGFLDAVLDEPDLPGVLVLGAFREAEVDEAHPLTAILARLRRTGTGEVRLGNLPLGEVGILVADMLRLPAPEAAPLAEVLAVRTGGNPFDTVELINALRREGALVPDGNRWHWDAGTLRRFVGRGDVVDLLGTRIEALPAASRELLEAMACLGGDVDLKLLQVASGQPAEAIGIGLLPPAEDGLVAISREGSPAASFRHDRVQQAAYGRLDPVGRAKLGLAMARRLATEPRYALAAAQQYLPALDQLTDPAERRTTAALLRGAATAARMVSNHVAAETFLAATLSILDESDESYRDAQAEWHASLCGLGRFTAADVVFEQLQATETDPVRHAGAVCEQVVGYTNRGMLGKALALGLNHLPRLGVPVPDEMGPGIDAGLETLYGWLADGDADDDLRRPELTDIRLQAVARVINRMIPPAFFSDQTTFAWLVMQAAEVWARHGAAAALVGPASDAGFVTIPLRDDYRAGYQAARRVLAVGEARGYEPDTAQAKFLHALGTIAWFEPIEHGVRLAHEARDGLLRGGDLQNAANTCYVSVAQFLDCAPDLDAYGVEIDAARALCARIGYDHATAMLVSYGQLRRALRGETLAPGVLTDDMFDEEAHLESVAADPTAAINFHICRALSAAIFGDEAALIQHSRAAVPLLPFITATYNTAQAHTLIALGAAARARTASGDDRDEALAALIRSRDFLAARAADHRGNFRHLHRLVEAEQAWLAGDFTAAATAYDAAACDSSGAGRPWHAALIAERAGTFFLAHGMEHAGHGLLNEAFHTYGRWGAHGKVRQLEREHPFVTTAPVMASTRHSSSSINVSAGVIDLLAVLEAARALSSETDLDRLRLRVEQTLSAMTGATQVHVVLWDDDTSGWALPADALSGRPKLSLSEAAEQGLLPLTALRYAERTREPMLVDDASRDDRVARDPYLSGLAHCSLMVVPVISQGAPKAMLVLENRLTRRAFSTGRLDAVLLIAGQLTVSLDNALVYASLERKVAERTQALAEANRQLELLTITDPLTGLANRRRLTDVLEAEWLHALRSGRPLAFAMIDIDNFKKYNDNYGHHGGDECLRRVARALQGSVRVTDLAARYGGEEFSIVMPGTDLSGALMVAERARQAVADLCEPHALADNGIVTISVGVTAVTPTDGAQPDQLIKVADEALYMAKRGGRNRVAAA